MSNETKTLAQVGGWSAAGAVAVVLVGGSFWPGWVLEKTVKERILTATTQLRGELCAARYLAKYGPEQTAALAKLAYMAQSDAVEKSGFGLDADGSSNWNIRRECVTGIEKLAEMKSAAR